MRLTIRAIVAGALSWFFLLAWDVLIGDERKYLTVGKVYVPFAAMPGNQNALLKPEHLATLQPHETALMSEDLRRKAEARVQQMHPRLAPEFIELRSRFSTHKGIPLIEVSSVNASPTYPAALIDELVWAHLAELKREREQTPGYKAYSAAAGAVLQAQRDVADLRKKLDSLPQDTTTQQARDSILAELQQAEKRWKLAQAVLAQLPRESEFPVIIYDKARSEPYEHALDPVTLLVHHPWRALASLVVASLLTLFLIPQSVGTRTRSICEGLPA